MIDAQKTTANALLFRVLSHEQCGELYEATLQCLEHVGVQVRHAEAKRLLLAAGAEADAHVVRIPRRLVKDALAGTPPSFEIWSRDQQRVMPVAIDKINFGPGLTNTYFQDPYSGERRHTRRGDPAMTARVCDALEQIDYAMGLGLIDDVPAHLAPVYEFAELISNTTKPVLAWAYDIDNLELIDRMAAAVVGGRKALRERPIYGVFATYQSPLVNTDEDLAKLLWAAERNMPFIYLGGPIVGLTSPMTGASALVLALAAALSGVVVAQLKQPGAPIAVGGLPAPADLRTSRMAYGAPESSLYGAAFADLCRYLELPYMGAAGASESKLPDSQAAIESAIQLVFSALSGTPLVHDLGFLDCAELGSLALLVMTDEIVAMIRRIMRGVAVNAETIMLDLIQRVGPGGNFMAEPRSAMLCRQEIWLPGLMNRDHHTIWEQKGGRSMEDRVAERLQQILETHQPEPLSPIAQKQIAAILLEIAVQ
jgi:trimethylamine---corrinoid protein Co-methyltransferase